MVLVLSAWYGLVPLDRVLRPYDQRMDEDGHVDAVGIAASYLANVTDPGDVVALLPKDYFDALDEALSDLAIWPMDCYEATAGIGYQRRINTQAVADAA